jgi:hypothetical protein
MRARLPGNQLKSAGILVVFRSVLRIPLGKHPCYQLHSALDGGTGKKHVHVMAPGYPCAAVGGTLNIFTVDTQMPMGTEFWRKVSVRLWLSSQN